MEDLFIMKKTSILILSTFISTGFTTEYIGTGVGAIPDGVAACGTMPASVRTVSFNVSGEASILRDLNINLQLSHTWLGDVSAKLIAPDATELILFSRTGAVSATDCGDGSILQGDYIFGDTATSNWWIEANGVINGVAIPSNLSYRTSEAGGAGQTNPAPLTSLIDTFKNVNNIDGVWQLELSDWASGDEGSINSASLFLDTAIFYNGFE